MYDRLCLCSVEAIYVVSVSAEWLFVGELISWSECWYIVPGGGTHYHLHPSKAVRLYFILLIYFFFLCCGLEAEVEVDTRHLS